MAAMALVMIRFEDGPLRGVTLRVERTAEDHRHSVRESIGAGGEDRYGKVRTTILVYRRSGRTAFALDREESGGID